MTHRYVPTCDDWRRFQPGTDVTYNDGPADGIVHATVIADINSAGLVTYNVAQKHRITGTGVFVKLHTYELRENTDGTWRADYRPELSQQGTWP